LQAPFKVPPRGDQLQSSARATELLKANKAIMEVKTMRFLMTMISPFQDFGIRTALLPHLEQVGTVLARLRCVAARRSAISARAGIVAAPAATTPSKRSLPSISNLPEGQSLAKPACPVRGFLGCRRFNARFPA